VSVFAYVHIHSHVYRCYFRIPRCYFRRTQPRGLPGDGCKCTNVLVYACMYMYIHAIFVYIALNFVARTHREYFETACKCIGTCTYVYLYWNMYIYVFLYMYISTRAYFHRCYFCMCQIYFRCAHPQVIPGDGC